MKKVIITAALSFVLGMTTLPASAQVVIAGPTQPKENVKKKEKKQKEDSTEDHHGKKSRGQQHKLPAMRLAQKGRPMAIYMFAGLDLTDQQKESIRQLNQKQSEELNKMRQGNRRQMVERDSNSTKNTKMIFTSKVGKKQAPDSLKKKWKNESSLRRKFRNIDSIAKFQRKSPMREMRGNYLKELSKILTPEQYTKFLENYFINNPQQPMRMQPVKHQKMGKHHHGMGKHQHEMGKHQHENNCCKTENQKGEQ